MSKHKATNEYKLVSIHWMDARVSYPAWYDVDEATELGCTPVHSVGWLIHKDEHKLVIAQGIELPAASKKACVLMAIPLGCIKSINHIKVRS